MISISELAIYPVKSCGQIKLSQCSLDPFGLQMDRRWMLVDENGKFLSQRLLAKMCLIQPELIEGGVTLIASGLKEFRVSVASLTKTISVTLWGDSCQALDCGDEAANSLSTFLGKKCRLVYFPDNEVRQVDPAYARTGDKTAFSDGFPMLLISEASLEDLNQRIKKTNPGYVDIEMLRFRPNIVVSGCEPFAEDSWSTIQVGDAILNIVKPCSRCVIPSIDPRTAQRGDEPTQTLKTFRRGVCGQTDKKLYFGQNVIASTGLNTQLKVGMPVSVLD